MRVIMPGSYDPVTAGHLAMIERVAKMYDEVFVVVFRNPNKSYTFTLEDRVAMLMLATDKLDNVMVSYSDGLVVDYMREHGIDKIVKGYRNDSDLEWERRQAEFNSLRGYDTELLRCDDELSEISSTRVRELLLKGEPVDALVPECVYEYLRTITERKEIK